MKNSFRIVLRLPLPLGVVIGLSACASSPDNWAVNAPGKFAFYSCDQLADQGKSTVARAAELEGAMAKSAQSPGGALVNAVAYDGEYAAAQADLRELEITATHKKCNVTWRTTSDRIVR